MLITVKLLEFLRLTNGSTEKEVSTWLPLVASLMFICAACVIGRILLENLRAYHRCFKLTLGLRKPFEVERQRQTNSMTTQYEYSLLIWDFKMRKLYEVFGESAPQLCFQLYILYRTEDLHWLNFIAIASSLKSFVTTVFNMIRHSETKFYKVDPRLTVSKLRENLDFDERLPFQRNVLILFTLFFEISTRVLVISMAFAGIQHQWAPLAMFGLMLIRPTVLTYLKWKHSEYDPRRTYFFFILIFVSSVFISDEFLFHFNGRYPSIVLAKSQNVRSKVRGYEIACDRLSMVSENVIIMSMWSAYTIYEDRLNAEFVVICIIFVFLQISTLLFGVSIFIYIGN